jgi:hypothetical protein
MATIHRDGTTSHTPRLLESPTCCGMKGTVVATYRHLTELFGEPDTGLDGDEAFWVIRIEALPERAMIVLPDVPVPTLAAAAAAETALEWLIIGHVPGIVEPIHAAVSSRS